MSNKTINISLPQDLIRGLDKIAKNDYTSRSDVIRRAVLREVREQKDEWGDPAGWWESGIDLRDKNGRGMPAKKFLALLKKPK